MNQNSNNSELLRKGMRRAIEIDKERHDSIEEQRDDEDDIAYYRRVYEIKRAYWNQERPEVREVIDDHIVTRTGAIRCRFYHSGNHSAPVLFFIHGGGFVLGSLDTHDRIMRLHAEGGSCTVVGIEYSKSPEFKFPHARNEILDVLQYCYDKADELDLNRDKFCIGGDSAGAHLSLACMLYLRDNPSDVKINCALLYYGSYGLLDSVSIRRYGHEKFGLAWQTMEWYKNSYLSNYDESFNKGYNLLLDSMHDLAPMLILSLRLDPLCDDSVALAESVRGVGGIYKYSEYDGVLHGFLHFSKELPDAYLAIAEGCSFMWTYLNN